MSSCVIKFLKKCNFYNEYNVYHFAYLGIVLHITAFSAIDFKLNLQPKLTVDTTFLAKQHQT